MERLISMILRRLMNKGINAGVRAVSQRGQRNEDTPREDREMAQRSRQQGKSLRQATRMMRRLGRF